MLDYFGIPVNKWDIALVAVDHQLKLSVVVGVEDLYCKVRFFEDDCTLRKYYYTVTSSNKQLTVMPTSTLNTKQYYTYNNLLFYHKRDLCDVDWLTVKRKEYNAT